MTNGARPEAEDRNEIEDRFAAWALRVEGGEDLSIEDLLNANPSRAEALQRLYDDWIFFAPVLGNVVPGLIPSDAGMVVPSLSPRSELGAEPPSSELLARLGIHVPDEGRYRFRAVLGRGGGGVVLKVWDTKLNRPLAMKVVLGQGEDRPRGEAPHVDGRTVARFVDEARIASQLDHPGIVPVHELGSDKTGRAFFTMKLVRGENFSVVLSHVKSGHEGWSQARALGVLLKVCEALAFAHDKGVIHRDLKPANIMVGRYGEVHVMDWGLARVINGSLPGETPVASVRQAERLATPHSPLLSAVGSALGTPIYMPPEQARGEHDRVDARSDVYSVGAMLYELLTGQMPYLSPGTSASPQAILAMVLAAPPLPIEKLAPETTPELVAICNCAMAYEPAQRYANTQRLANDLRAFLEGRVVAAHEAGTWAETRKWVKRNRGLAGALATIFVVAIGGSIALSAKAEEATANLAKAEKATLRAEDSARLAQDNEAKATQRERDALASARRADEVTRFMQLNLTQSNPDEEGTENYRVSDAMESAIQTLDQGRLSDAPDIEASLRLTIASILLGNGRPQVALQLAEHGLESLDRLYPADHGEKVNALNVVGQCLVHLGRAREALPKYVAALEMNRHLQSGDNRAVAASMTSLGSCLALLGRQEEALSISQDALEMLTRLGGEESHDLVAVHTNLGCALENLGRSEEAMSQHEEALEISQRLYKGDHSQVATSLNNLASALDSLGRSDEALARYQAALAMRRRLNSGDHSYIVTYLSNVGFCLTKLHRPEEALPYYKEALAMRLRLIPMDHELTTHTLNALGRCLEAGNCCSEALPYYSAALEMRLRIEHGDHREVAQYYNDVGVCLLKLNRPAEALSYCECGLRMTQRLYYDGLEVATALNNVAYCYAHLRQGDQALIRFQQASDVYERVFAEDHPDVLRSLTNIVQAFLSVDRSAEALLIAEKLVSITDRAFPVDSPERQASVDLLRSVEERLSREFAASSK